jgi:hypothetical protein
MSGYLGMADWQGGVMLTGVLGYALREG